MAEQVRRELSELVRDEIKDPRVNWVSFTAVKVSRDLSSAVIYFTVLNEDERDQAEEGLNKASGFIRRELSNVYVPVSFHPLSLFMMSVLNEVHQWSR